MVSNSMGPENGSVSQLSNAMGFQNSTGRPAREGFESQGVRYVEAGGDNSDNFVDAAIQRDMRADYGRVSPETAFPKPLTNQHHVFTTVGVFLRPEVASSDRLYTKKREEIACHTTSVQTLRLSLARQRPVAINKRREIVNAFDLRRHAKSGRH